MTNFSDQIDNAANQVADQVESLPDRVEAAASQMPERGEDPSQKADDASHQVPDQIESVKAAITKPLPTPPSMSATQAPVDELLKRLKWGEPALTIIDVRSREAFNDERITGAVPISIDQIPDGVESTLERKRDIYIYGDNADQAASQLRQAGYANVAVLQGGLSAWKGIGGPTEGIAAFSSPVSA